MRGGFIHTRRVGCFREVTVYEMPYLPEEGFVHRGWRVNKIGATCKPPQGIYFIAFKISSARSILITFSTTICAATFSINSPDAPAAIATYAALAPPGAGRALEQVDAWYPVLAERV